MPEVKYDPRKGGPEQRIHDRQKNSGGVEADTIVKTGDGARRTFQQRSLVGLSKAAWGRQ